MVVLYGLKQRYSRLTLLSLKSACMSSPSSVAATLRPNVRQKLAIKALSQSKTRSCSRSVELKSNRTTKLKAINEQSNHKIMHHNCFGETNRFAS